VPQPYKLAVLEELTFLNAWEAVRQLTKV